MATRRTSARTKPQLAVTEARLAKVRLAAGKARPKRVKRATRKGVPRKWPAQVLQRSAAPELGDGVFSKRTAREIALSLKRSAEASRPRKAEPFRSAMSRLTFHINRRGPSLSPERRRVLNQAKEELRRVFGR